MAVANALAYDTATIAAIKSFINTCSRAQCFKTFSVSNLRIFLISWSVCIQQVLQAYSNVYGQGPEPTLEWSI